jgi:hypothetical protein
MELPRNDLNEFAEIFAVTILKQLRESRVQAAPFHRVADS